MQHAPRNPATRTARSQTLCDDFAGYNQSLTLGIIEARRLTHLRQKFFNLHVSNKSQIVVQALGCIAHLNDVEREIKTLPADERLQIC